MTSTDRDAAQLPPPDFDSAKLTSRSSRPVGTTSLCPLNVRDLAVLSGLVLFLWSGIFHLHPPVGWVDPGLYIYWMLRPVENAALRGVDYHAARLSFILPGALFYRIFDMVTAQAFLVTSFYVLGLVAVSFIAAGVLRSFTARLLVLVIIGTNTLWIAAFSRGYMDGAAIALGLGAMACMLSPRAAPGPCHHLAAGILLVLAFCAHPVGGGVAGFTAIFVGLARAPSWQAILSHGLAAVVGAFLSLLLLGIVAMSLGMPFPFLATLTSTINHAITGGFEIFASPVSAWLADAPRLMIVPAILLMLAAGLRGLPSCGRQGLAVFAAGIVPLVLLGVWLTRSTAMMQYSFYASYLMLSLVPALVLFMHRLETVAPDRAWRGVGWLVPGLLLATSIGTLLPLGLRADPRFAVATWMAVGAAFLVGLAMCLRRRPALALAALAVTLALAGSLNADTARAYRFAREGADHAAHHAALQRLHEILAEAGTLRGKYHLWFARDEFTTERALPPAELHDLIFGSEVLRMNVLDSLTASLGWHRTTIGFSMPRLEADRLTPLAHNLGRLGGEPEGFVALCAERPQCEQGLATLQELGVRVSAESFRTIEVPHVPRIVVATATISALGPREEPSREQLGALLARVLRADAWAAAAGTAFPDDAARATWRDAAWPPHPDAPLALGTSRCIAGDMGQHCFVTTGTDEARGESRHFRFRRNGQLWMMTHASAPVSEGAMGALAVWADQVRDMIGEAVQGNGPLLTWFGPGGEATNDQIQAADLLDIIAGTTRRSVTPAEGGAGPLARRVESLGDTMPRAYRHYHAWMRLTQMDNETFQLLTVCASVAECDDAKLAVREIGMQVSARRSFVLEVPNLPSVVLSTAQVFAPSARPEPDLAQLSAVLERILRLDAWEAETGRSIADYAQRALFFEPGWRSPQATPPLVQRAVCVPGPRVQDCRVWYADADGRLVSRALGFQRHGNRWWNSTDIPPGR